MTKSLKTRIKEFNKSVFRHPITVEVIGFIAFLYAWFVGKTSKFDIKGIKEFEQMLKENDGGIFVAWHGRALMLPYFWSNPRQMKALVSPHQDGRIIAGLLRRFHILSIDGSTDRKSTSAALEIVHELNLGTTVALIPDGPRGPRMHLNKSVIYFAQKTGKPVMGLTYSCNGAKVANSWDAMLLPKPFSKGKVGATKPLFVPQTADDAELERLRLNFEQELNTITLQLDKECGLPEILPGTTAKEKRNRK